MERDSSSSTMFAMFGWRLCCSSRSTPTSAFIAATWCGARASLARVQLLTATSPPEPTCRARTTCEKAPAAIGPSVSYSKRASGSAKPRRAAPVLGRGGIGRTADIGRRSMLEAIYSPPADMGRAADDVRGRRDRSLRSERPVPSVRPVSRAVVRWSSVAESVERLGMAEAGRARCVVPPGRFVCHSVAFPKAVFLPGIWVE
eukprot:scaffold89804_cov62-Phaeocystis_antarctica.AAC.1